MLVSADSADLRWPSLTSLINIEFRRFPLIFKSEVTALQASVKSQRSSAEVSAILKLYADSLSAHFLSIHDCLEKLERFENMRAYIFDF